MGVYANIWSIVRHKTVEAEQIKIIIKSLLTEFYIFGPLGRMNWV
jgi:hypothetical protein